MYLAPDKYKPGSWLLKLSDAELALLGRASQPPQVWTQDELQSLGRINHVLVGVPSGKVKSPEASAPTTPSGTDREVECVVCHNTFLFTARQQEEFAERRFSPPKRCRDCKAVQRAEEATRG